MAAISHGFYLKKTQRHDSTCLYVIPDQIEHAQYVYSENEENTALDFKLSFYHLK